MRVIVCGDRNWDDEQMIVDVLGGLPKDTIIITGGCRGADTLASEHAFWSDFKVETYRAEWTKYGMAAGPIRNQKMLDSGCDLVLAFHNDIEHSKGTKHMVEIATKKGIPVKVYGYGD